MVPMRERQIRIISVADNDTSCSAYADRYPMVAVDEWQVIARDNVYTIHGSLCMVNPG